MKIIIVGFVCFNIRIPFFEDNSVINNRRSRKHRRKLFVSPFLLTPIEFILQYGETTVCFSIFVYE
jgi:hypothetical protein